MTSRILLLTGLLAAVYAQSPSAPMGLETVPLHGPFGTVTSHSAFGRGSYLRGQRTRYVITFPQGQTGQVAIDVTNRDSFLIRTYDFAVIMDASIVSKVQQPCDVGSYTAAGRKNEDYMSITMTNTAQPRVLTSKSGGVVIDFCASTYDSGRNDANMRGFRAFWMTFARPVVPSTSAPSSPVPTSTAPPFTGSSAPPSSSTAGLTNSPSSAQPSSPPPTGTSTMVPSSSLPVSSSVAPVTVPTNPPVTVIPSVPTGSTILPVTVSTSPPVTVNPTASASSQLPVTVPTNPPVTINPSTSDSTIVPTVATSSPVVPVTSAAPTSIAPVTLPPTDLPPVDFAFRPNKKRSSLDI